MWNSSASGKGNDFLRYSDHVEGNGLQFFKQACEFGIEGVVSKLAYSPYESTRNNNWQKTKCLKRQEFVIAGYTPSKKGFPGFGSLVLGVHDKKKLIYAGRAGTGFSIKQRLELQKKLDRIAQPTMPFVTSRRPGFEMRNGPDPNGGRSGIHGVDCGWSDPASIFKGLREDKKASEVVREEQRNLRIGITMQFSLSFSA